MDELILHHYDFSNFSEKVRLMLGLKRLCWCSVEIPATEPKPDYTPLTGGYRRTPALQIGADVYCDTRLIAEELEARHPEPTLFPGSGAGRARALADALAPWAERQLLRPLALYVTGVRAARFSPQFHADRARLHGKAPPSLERVEAAARRSLAQLRPQLAILEALLAAPQPFLLGDQPSLADITVYQAPWFLEAIGGPSPLLAGRTRTRAWMARMQAIGHGQRVEMSAAQALARAYAAAPVALPPAGTDPAEADVGIGDPVTVTPLEEVSPALGTLAYQDDRRIVLRCRHERVGEVHVHFPRIGYGVRRA